MDRIRLDKYLCDLGIAPRSECRRIIRSGRVRVGGETVAAPETKIDPRASDVTLDGERLVWAEHHYYMMNKPAGVLTATEDLRQKTVLDLLPEELRRMGLFPVGRLDRDTRGLLLLTDDGEFAHRVISPKFAKKCMMLPSRGRPTRPTPPLSPRGSCSATGRNAVPPGWSSWKRDAASSR